ncbi:hypothetical protein EV182_000566 [Spiromyces aspiralis]|uniref:Uncharacterized protein n=1 Tax=Spiromyces aspiralis TaxID=68401 RepID=A0ACC1HVU1_9FUNG|nr:hypothetical protein EV182_000566 [Spiromyces aspiralis]
MLAIPYTFGHSTTTSSSSTSLSSLCFNDFGKTNSVLWRTALSTDIDLIVDACASQGLSRACVEQWFEWQNRRSRVIYLFFDRSNSSLLIGICAIDFIDEEGMDLNVASRTTLTAAISTLYVHHDLADDPLRLNEIWNVILDEACSTELESITVRAPASDSTNAAMARALDLQPFKSPFASPHQLLFRRSLC